MEEKKPAGRPGIGRERYTSQIEAWLSEGSQLNEITATSLQKAVGGQYRKAVEILEEFKAGYEAKELADLPEPPEQLNNLLNGAALQIWRMLCEEQRRQIEAVAAEYDRQRGKLEAIALERLQRIDDLEQEVSGLSGSLHDAESDREAMRDDLNALRAQLAEQQERNRQLSDRLTDRDRELSETAQELRDTRTELQDVRRELDQQQRNGVELSASLRDTRAELAQATAEAKRCKADGLKRVEEVQGLQEQLQAVRQELTALDKALSVEQAERVAADRMVDQLKGERDLCQGERKALEDDLAKGRADLAARSAQLEQVEKACTAAEQRAEQLQGQLVELAKGGANK